MVAGYPLVRPVVDCQKAIAEKRDVVLTVQADRDEADINKIIARFEKAGMVSSLNKSQPYYGDVSEFEGLQDAMIKVQNAELLFMDMSAQVRERFDNDPVKMIDFLADERNRAEAISLGMVVAPPAPVLAPPAPVVPAP